MIYLLATILSTWLPVQYLLFMCRYDLFTWYPFVYLATYSVSLHTVRKEIKCSGDFEILNGFVHDTTRISPCFSDFRFISRTISCSSSESPLHFISFFNSAEQYWIYCIVQCTVYSVLCTVYILKLVMFRSKLPGHHVAPLLPGGGLAAGHSQ